MRQFQIDELRLDDYQKLKKYFDINYDKNAIEGIYWIPLPEKFYSKVQNEHKDCQSFYFILNLEETFLISELLIRSKKSLKCDCIAFAEENQLLYILQFIDDVFKELEILY